MSQSTLQDNRKYANEFEMQAALYHWIKTRTNLESSFFHFANERKTSYQYGNKLKLMGVKAGVADIFISRGTSGKNKIYKGMWIELKHGNNKPTSNQIRFLSDRAAEGYKVFWSNNITDVIKLIKECYPCALVEP